MPPAIPPVFYAVLALFAISLGGGVVYTYKTAIERAQVAEKARDEARQAFGKQLEENGKLRDRAAALDKQLAARQARTNALDEAGRKIDARLSAVYTTPAVREWGDTPVPGALLAGLRDAATSGAGSAEAGPAAGVISGSGASPGVAAVNDKPGSTRLRPATASKAPALQRGQTGH